MKKWGTGLDTVSIEEIKRSFDFSLEKAIGLLSEDELTNENMQPRIRSTILMAIANKHNRLLLCTSNKSEGSVGYTTLYGDMTGAFAPIADLYKTQVYALSKWRNNNIPPKVLSTNIVQKVDIIPQNIIHKEPSAELKYNQKDSDSLLEYDLLDKILYDLLEAKLDKETISEKYNLDILQVEKIERLIAYNEFKRFQAPPGVKINRIMLSNDRRYPICKKTLFA
jgi:NAD+ synthase